MVVPVALGGFVADQMNNLESAQYLWKTYDNREEEDLPASKTMLAHRYNGWKTT